MRARATGMKRMGSLLVAFCVLAGVAPLQAADTDAARKTPRKPDRLSVFTNGVAQGMHAVCTQPTYDALLSPMGVLMVYPKVKGERIGVPLTMRLSAYYAGSAGTVGRPIVTFEDDPGPLLNPATVELKGKLTDDVEYSVTFQFEKNAVSLRGYGKDPAGLKSPTVFRLAAIVPAFTNFPPEIPQAERETRLKGLAFVVRGGGKQFVYPYANGAVFSRRAESCWIDGPVYGTRKLSFEVKSPRTAPMRPVIYPQASPYMGYAVYMYKNDMESRNLAERLVLKIE